MKRKIILITILGLGLVWLILPQAVCLGATYYVATNGNDSYTKAQAQSIDTPWLTINHGVSQLSAGDTLQVRGGIYREEVTVGVSGTSGNRITIKNHPGERPIVEGTGAITGWTQCESDDAGLKDIDGVINPNFANIYWAEVDENYIDDIKNVILFEDGNRLFIAQDPDQSNAAIQDRYEYRLIPNEGGNYGQNLFIVDSANLTQSNDYWNDAWIRTYDALDTRFKTKINISDFIASQNKIILAEPAIHSFASNDRYSIFNHPSILDKQGEYYHTIIPVGGKYRIYLWPNDPADLTNKIGIPALTYGFAFNQGADYITLEGFEVQGIKSDSPSVKGGIGVYGDTGVIIKNNIVHDIYGFGIYFKHSHDSMAENNIVYNIAPGSTIWVYNWQNNPANIIIKNNTIHNSESSSILFQYVEGGRIIDNRVDLSPGAHNVGITVYSFSKDILVAGNIAPYLRINQAEDITIFNNIFTGVGGSPIATWGGDMSGTVAIVNNVLLNTNPGIYDNTGNGFDDLDTLIVKNNIVTSITDRARDKADRSNNLYTDTLPSPAGTGSFLETDLTKIFVNPANDDFRLKERSPAIDAGCDVTQYLPTDTFSDFNFTVDILGNLRDVALDIGCYEYGASSVEPEPSEPPEEPAEPHADIPDITSLQVSNNIIKKSENTSATIQCDLKEAGNLSVKIYDAKGVEIITLCHEHKEAGSYTFSWSGKDSDANRVGSGIYIVHMKSGDYTETKKIAVIK